MKNLKPSDITSSVLDDVRGVEQSQTDFAKAIDMLMNDNYPRRKARFDRNTISDLTVLDTIAQIYEIDFLRQFISTFSQYTTSIEGKGRQEVVDIAKYSIDRQDKMHQDILGSLRR
jgi:hypothetical protein